MIKYIDNFFKDPLSIREELLKGLFTDYQSDWDAVVYPGIQYAIPQAIKDEYIKELEKLIGFSIDPKTIFARETSNRVAPAPNYLHSDRIMSQFSAHVYISLDWPRDSGTAFWKHKVYGDRESEHTNIPQFILDVQELPKWSLVELAQGKFNRCLVHDSTLYHSAEPYGGWGNNAEDGRVVLTCFFNLKE